MTLCDSTLVKETGYKVNLLVKETEKDDYAVESRDQSATKCLINRTAQGSGLRYALHGVKGQAKQASSADQQAIRTALVKLTPAWVGQHRIPTPPPPPHTHTDTLSLSLFLSFSRLYFSLPLLSLPVS